MAKAKKQKQEVEQETPDFSVKSKRAPIDILTFSLLRGKSEVHHAFEHLPGNPVDIEVYNAGPMTIRVHCRASNGNTIDPKSCTENGSVRIEDVTKCMVDVDKSAGKGKVAMGCVIQFK